MDKSGRLCEKTIELPPSLGSHPSLFTVQDLSQDSRFKNLPFVTGPPYFKFYAGTPLTTKRGINVGSLFIIDDAVREPLNLDQEKFLGTIAKTIMEHMTKSSEAEERKRVMRLSLGMNAFVERKARLKDENVQPEASVRISTKSIEQSPQKKRSRSSNQGGNGRAGNKNNISPSRFRSIGENTRKYPT